MIVVWYLILAGMLTAYAVLDGFDLGAGVVHLFVAKSEEERRQVLASIGPLWDGNEVWLLASGGVLVFAFPRAYAAAFSGLYLALMIVLWLLVLRGLAIEFRSKLDNPLWRSAWDTTFAGASIALAVVFGVALGNVIRGVPLDASGYFQQDLFPGMGTAHAATIDAFTTSFGAFALVALAAHGATFLAWKTSEEPSRRSSEIARVLWFAAVALAAVATLLTAVTQPAFFARFLERPLLWPLPVAGFGAALLSRHFLSKNRELPAFLASSAFVACLLGATAGALYPVILRSTVDESFTITAESAATQARSLAVGLAIWIPGLTLAIGYFVFLFRAFRGKVRATGSNY